MSYRTLVTPGSVLVLVAVAYSCMFFTQSNIQVLLSQEQKKQLRDKMIEYSEDSLPIMNQINVMTKSGNGRGLSWNLKGHPILI